MVALGGRVAEFVPGARVKWGAMGIKKAAWIETKRLFLSLLILTVLQIARSAMSFSSVVLQVRAV